MTRYLSSSERIALKKASEIENSTPGIRTFSGLAIQEFASNAPARQFQRAGRGAGCW